MGERIDEILNSQVTEWLEPHQIACIAQRVFEYQMPGIHNVIDFYDWNAFYISQITSNEKITKKTANADNNLMTRGRLDSRHGFYPVLGISAKKLGYSLNLENLKLPPGKSYQSVFQCLDIVERNHDSRDVGVLSGLFAIVAFEFFTGEEILEPKENWDFRECFPNEIKDGDFVWKGRKEKRDITELDPFDFFALDNGDTNVVPEIVKEISGENYEKQLFFVDKYLEEHKETFCDILRTHSAIILESPTGTGKTHVYQKIHELLDYYRKGKVKEITETRDNWRNSTRMVYVCHSRALAIQQAKGFAEKLGYDKVMLGIGSDAKDKLEGELLEMAGHTLNQIGVNVEIIVATYDQLSYWVSPADWGGSVSDFSRCNVGTIFMDEIHEMSISSGYRDIMKVIAKYLPIFIKENTNVRAIFATATPGKECSLIMEKYHPMFLEIENSRGVAWVKCARRNAEKNKVIFKFMESPNEIISEMKNLKKTGKLFVLSNSRTKNTMKLSNLIDEESTYGCLRAQTLHFKSSKAIIEEGKIEKDIQFTTIVGVTGLNILETEEMVHFVVPIGLNNGMSSIPQLQELEQFAGRLRRNSENLKKGYTLNILVCPYLKKGGLRSFMIDNREEKDDTVYQEEIKLIEKMVSMINDNQLNESDFLKYSSLRGRIGGLVSFKEKIPFEDYFGPVYSEKGERNRGGELIEVMRLRYCKEIADLSQYLNPDEVKFTDVLKYFEIRGWEIITHGKITVKKRNLEMLEAEDPFDVNDEIPEKLKEVIMQQIDFLDRPGFRHLSFYMKAENKFGAKHEKFKQKNSQFTGKSKLPGYEVVEDIGEKFIKMNPETGVLEIPLDYSENFGKMYSIIENRIFKTGVGQMKPGIYFEKLCTYKIEEWRVLLNADRFRMEHWTNSKKTIRAMIAERVKGIDMLISKEDMEILKEEIWEMASAKEKRLMELWIGDNKEWGKDLANKSREIIRERFLHQLQRQITDGYFGFHVRLLKNDEKQKVDKSKIPLEERAKIFQIKEVNHDVSEVHESVGKELPYEKMRTIDGVNFFFETVVYLDSLKE